MSDTNCTDQLSAQGYVPHTELYSGLWTNVRRNSPLPAGLNDAQAIVALTQPFNGT